ncbi:hypothetical protein PACTADRAFT_75375 [Pachysolen tannophilus NRRL Y-2460]|uniref:Uncharacterized protein n=1 Tax=Pachysolen tannophilus NRRL Y-2460 TaxID=669874 RepID=A0A1E4TWS7_PACTA|nr:hypothetical protein PACTADRAFT_75375 [Pachysolen tannophilus NRRL Y-2460]
MVTQNFISKTLAQLPAHLRNSNGVGLNSRRRKLSLTFIPQSKNTPWGLMSNNDDRRSFLSLGSELESEREDVGGDNESVSTFRSLPSTLEGSPEPDQLSWLIEEHQRRFSGESSVYDEDDDNDVSPSSSRRRRRPSLMSLPMGDEDEDFANEVVTPKSELKMMFKYASPLVITFLLEQVFSVVCVLTVSHLGTSELAAVSLASMTSTIVFAIFEGCATSLDTLCPQAYGAGNFTGVGVHFQRCCAFSLILFIPFGIFWYHSSFFLKHLIEDKEVIRLTELFLRWLLLGAPPYIIFECGKRFLQAQGIFEAGTGILFVTAPINVLLSYLLVWDSRIGLGFIGAPIAASINFWLMLLLMILYVEFVDGKKCWGGFTKEAFTHFYDLSKLAVPGIIMLEAEYLAYEILTLFSSYFGTNTLAAQSAVSTVASLTYMVPFAVGIASSTRIANFIGAENISSAKVATHIGLYSALVVGVLNCLILLCFRKIIANLFSKDPAVISLIVSVFPLVAVIQIFDGISSVASGILRAQGRQNIGGLINLFIYYVVAIPLSLVLAKHLHLQLYGLWIGIGVGMILIGNTETWFILTANWNKIVEAAKMRNEADADTETDENENETQQVANAPPIQA